MKSQILLVDLPTYPKGTISLSLFVIAAALKQDYDPVYLDMNFNEDKKKLDGMDFSVFKFAGMKVSAQNYSAAIELTRRIKTKAPELKVVWGGELPTLLPEDCLRHADTIVSGLFEPVAPLFSIDLQRNNLQRQYIGRNENAAGFLSPDFSILPDTGRYNSFMGLPLETSRGCTEKCTFCMVLTMQPKQYHLKTMEQLKNELPSYASRFINIVDYNFGVSHEHVKNVARLIEESDALGWMAEMNIELLDDDSMLLAMKKSRCRMIYCGLESVDEEALDSVNKAVTNKVANYQRLIRKVQSYGINIAAGVILGLDHADALSYRRTHDFYSRMGLIYAKLTFLTFNPGTRIKKYMQQHGTFVTETIDLYDGNHVTYLPKDITEQELYEATGSFITGFYSLTSIVKRAWKGPKGIFSKAGFILFNLCYRSAYQQWLSNDIFRQPENFNRLLVSGYSKTAGFHIAEKLLQVIRRYRKSNNN